VLEIIGTYSNPKKPLIDFLFMTEYPICCVTSPTPIAFIPEYKRILVHDESGVQVFNLKKMIEELFLKSLKNLNGAAVALS